jgi:hypothetical protein
MEQPTPDVADWTWVLDRQCPECEYVATDFERTELGGKIRANAAVWQQLLGRGEIVHLRPPVPEGASPVWSALEYGAHVRDVHGLYRERFELMLAEDDPLFANWDQDATAIGSEYHRAEPGAVAYALAVNAGTLADLLDRLDADEWERTGRRSDGADFTVESMGRYLLHDLVHHVWDVRKGYAAITAASD